MRRTIAVIFSLVLLVGGATAQVFNREPLEATLYAGMPLGSVRAEGWLREQLSRQAAGLTGHLDEVYPAVMGPSNAWLGGDGDAWERGPYWIDGLLPLAYILNDKSLIDKALPWVESILGSQQEDGYIGPATDHPFVYGLQRGGSHDWWPKMVALKILQQYYSATGDERVIQCLKGYFRYQAEHLEKTPLNKWSDWGQWRGADNLNVVYWLYNITGEEWLLDLGKLIHSQTTDWTSLFLDGSIFYNQGSVHCVNLGQGFKAPSVWWQYSHDSRDLEAPHQAVKTIRHTVGFPTGLWAGDEMLHFGLPTRGSELCTAVEMMYSLEEMLRITGDIRWADYLERVAYNALPSQINDDFTGKQYYQQVNQVSCDLSWRTFSTPHDDTDVLFGTLNGYPCCLSNMHQGWPKFTANLWYASSDGGLAALVYAPSSVTAKVAGGIEVNITESTDYPFRDKVNFTIGFTSKKVKKAAFPLRLRVPQWCNSASVSINGEAVEASAHDGVIFLSREWKRGDRVCLTLPMEVRTEEWFDKAWSVVRGPLVYALEMEETWSWKPFEGAHRHFGDGAWEISSSTPWNYCLMRDSFSAEDCIVTERADGFPDYPWNVQSAPIGITVPARTLPHWKVVDSVAFWTEDGDDSGEPCEIRLIPYGCTTLRIAAFPTRIVPWDLPFRK
ncbi:MAG: glycoside hydrolase family 127 protein [Bacteroidales bacterium]|nr:glycoside hydrolase family 127 protein [Bacteroidales bacterium]